MTESIKINWYRCKVDKALMSELMRKSDARAFLQVIPQFALFVLTGTLAYLAFRHLNSLNWPTALPLLRPTTPPFALSAAAREKLQRQYATIEITDSVSTTPAARRRARGTARHGRRNAGRAGTTRARSPGACRSWVQFERKSHRLARHGAAPLA